MAKGSKHSQVPLRKDADEKENINIVFIGHVGMEAYVYNVYTCTRTCTYMGCFAMKKSILNEVLS